MEPQDMVEAAVGEPTEPLPAADTTLISPQVSFEPQVTVGKTQIRFAEDILVPAPTKPGAKSKVKKKKQAWDKAKAEDGVKLKKRRLESEIPVDDEEY